MHYAIIVVIVLLIVIIQTTVYVKTKLKLKVFKNIFAANNLAYKTKKDRETEQKQFIFRASDSQLKQMLRINGMDIDKFIKISVHTDEKGETISTQTFDSVQAKYALVQKISVTESISSDYENRILKEILQSINNYLSNNKGNVSDFHLMKDIVDRNCDAVEEEINAQIPVPLYLGLMGTMIGILVGIGYLWISGDLNALLNSTPNLALSLSDSSEMLQGPTTSSGANGVEALLGGVALAMISSIWGILLTTFGSMRTKSAKARVERNKHIFLSWIQANLLPTLSNDTAQSIERMSNNLVEFNKTFSSNTKDLEKTLRQVNEATVLQKQLLEEVSKLNDKKLVVKNVELYTALQKSTGEVQRLCEFLNNSAEYLQAVKNLNEELDKGDKRAQAIENMLAFFEKETAQIEQRKLALSKAVGEVDDKLEEQLRKLSDHANENVANFYKALGKQQDALQSKLNETQVLISEIRNLSSIKDSISKFEKATAAQNKKIDQLTQSIEKLAVAKATGTTISEKEVKSKRPLWEKIVIVGVSSLVGFLLLAVIVANLVPIYNGLIELFRF